LGHDDGRLNTTPSLTSPRLHRLESKRFERGLTAANRRVEHMGYKGNSRQRGGMRKKIAVGATAAVVLALLFLYSTLSFSSGPATAASWPKDVSGYVYDDSDDLVVGADIDVEIWNGGTLRYTYPLDVTTDDEGFYAVSIGSENWDVGNTIRVNATEGSFRGTNSTVADSGPAQTIDVHFTEVIPEFGSVLVVVVSMVALIVLMSARKKSQSPRDGH
jgi:hypothetical protein